MCEHKKFKVHANIQSNVDPTKKEPTRHFMTLTIACEDCPAIFNPVEPIVGDNLMEIVEKKTGVME